jgi:hypothetical protein
VQFSGFQAVPELDKSDAPINEFGLGHEMSIDYFHHQMHIEAKRLAEHVYGYCDLDPHSPLAEKVDDLEAGELVSLFYLMAHERLSLEDALMQFDLVTAIRMHRKSSAGDIDAPSTCGSLSNCFPRERIHFGGFEWGIIDNRSIIGLFSGEQPFPALGEISGM